MQKNKRKARSAGFTLIELLVVVAIIGILGAVVAPKLLKKPQIARIQAAKTDVKAIQLAADMYQLAHSGRTIKSISDLVPSEFDEMPVDPWGGEYAVVARSDGGVKITCPKLDEIMAAEDKKGGVTDAEIGGN